MPVGSSEWFRQQHRALAAPTATRSAVGQAEIRQTAAEVAGPMDPASRALQENTRFGPLWKTLDGAMLALQELARPQKALFAGFHTWQRGGTSAQAVNAANDEFWTHIGTGNFKRDISGADLLDPDGSDPIESIFSGRGLLGLGIDMGADPVNIVPIGKIASAGGRLGSGIAKFAGATLDQNRLTRSAKNWIVDGFKDMFIKPRAQGRGALKAAEESRTRVQAFANEHQDVVIDEFLTNNRAYDDLLEETGMAKTEFDNVVTEAWGRIKIRDTKLGVPEPLNDTFARIYRDYGVDAFDNFARTAGKRAVRDEEPIRRAILGQEFDDLYGQLANKHGWEDSTTESVKDLIHSFKERDLERFIWEASESVTTTGAPRNVMESMQRDYVMIAATREFRDIISKLGYGQATKGANLSADLTPFHVSELHSQLQPIGIEEANRLLRSPWKGDPDGKLSEFVLVHPRTGARTHLPLMDQGFHTDPRLIDATRSYYAARSVEQAQVMEDLVGGYGSVLPDTMTIPKYVNGVAAVDRAGNPVMRTVRTFQKGVEAVRGRAVKTRTPQKIEGKFGEALTEELPNYKLTKEAAEHLEAEGLDILEGVQGFENAVLPKDAADLVKQVNKWQSGSFDGMAIGNAINTVQNQVWKPATLFFFPGYYIRNTITNALLQNMLGMNPADIVNYTARGSKLLHSGSHTNRFRRAREVANRYFGDDTLQNKKMFDNIVNHPTIVADETLASQSIKLRDLMDGVKFDDLPRQDDVALLQLVTELGVVRSGQYGATEIFRTLEDVGRAGGKIRGLTVNTNPIMAGGADFAMLAEDSQRVGAFLWAIEEKGMDILEARDWVIRGMVDFNNLTDFERNIVRKWAMPFYSWTRNSTPLVLESFVQDNAKWRAMNKIIQAQEETMNNNQTSLQDRLVPEYVAKGLAVPTGRDENGDYKYFLFDGWIPQSQLTDIDSVDELLKLVPTNLGPIPKTIIELYFQESIFLEKEFAVGNRSYVGARLPESMITILRNVRLLNTADSIIKAEDQGEVLDQVLRFFTGFNTVRIGKSRAALAYKARVKDMRQRITSSIMNAAREGHREEIPGLVEELQDFIKKGR